MFREYSELKNNDSCLDNVYNKRLSDFEVQSALRKALEGYEIDNIMNLPKEIRSDILGKVKNLEGVSLRKAAKLLGISPASLSRC